jgi:osmotically-inducible protein OsmY
MAQLTALLIRPTGEYRAAEPDKAPTAAPLLPPSLEDLCVAERVERALRATGYGPLRGVEVSVRSRLVILGGRVPSYYLKQVAQTTAQAVPGVHQVCNNLEVIGPS